MEIKYLKLIKTIAEEGNISNSAERLYLTQSALSHQLKEIEERLGFKIFIRNRTRWNLTEEGMVLYNLAEKILIEIEKGLSKINDIKAGSRGKIRISTECYSFYHGLPAFIQKMGVLYPDIEIDLVVEATHQPVPKLLSNELDMAIVTSPSSHDALLSIDLFADEIFAVVHEENPISKKKFITAQDFENLHLIIHSFPLETVSVYEHFLKVHHVMPKKITAIPLTEVALEMVAANMGVICIPKWAVSSFDIPDTLSFLKLGSQGFVRKHYLVLRQDDSAKKYFNDFIQNLTEEFDTKKF